MLFATCSFYEFTPDMGIPVRSSNGFPRFTLKYPLVHAMPSTFPSRKWLTGVARPEFEALYAQKIREVGVDALRAQAAEILRRESNLRGQDCTHRPVVLLCFERWNDPKKQPEFCHRHVLSAVLRDLGEEVTDYGAMPGAGAEIRADDQESLF